MSKPHQAIFGRLAPVDTGIFLRVDNVLFARRAPALRLIGKELHLRAARRALEIANLDVFFPAGTLGKHKKQ